MTIDDDGSISVDSLDTPRPLEDDDAAGPHPPCGTLSELMYEAENRSLKALALLSLGLLNDDGSPTFNPAVLPWSAALRPTTLKMTANELRNEVIRRTAAAENVLNAPRPKQWTVARSTDWLINNPIVAVDEVAFIQATIAHRIVVAERANIVVQPDAPSDPPAASKGSKWIGKLPHLRLIHAIIDDVDIKAAYIRRLHVPSGRMTVENRRTAEAVASNVWHMVAEKWNNQSFVPTTSVKDTHSDFALPISIPFDAICHFMPATPEKVEEKWNAMNLALKRQIQNWERSGQGDGGYTEEVDDNNNCDDDMDEDNMITFGSLKGRPQRALDLRQNFFDCRNTYLLYLWDVLDEHDLVQSSMQQLLEGIGSGNGGTGVPSVIGGKRKSDADDSLASSKKGKGRNNDDEAFAQLSDSIEKHSQSLVTAAKISASEQAKNRTQQAASEIHARIDSLRDSKRAMELRMTEPYIIDNQRSLDVIERAIKGIDDEIVMKTEQLNLMLATPTRNNHSPK